MAQNPSFIPNMTAGRGYMALAAMIFGKWHPVGALWACLLFGFLDAVSIRCRARRCRGIGAVPVQAIQALPYVLTVVLLAGFIGRAWRPRRWAGPTSRSVEMDIETHRRDELLAAARAVREAGLRTRTRALPSAPRCSTNRAASTPAATSRTPPTRRAGAPRPRAGAWWLAGGRRVLAVVVVRRGAETPSRPAAAAGRSCANLRPTTAPVWMADLTATARRAHPGRVAARSFGPHHLNP
jgi:hypothetical protein